MGGSPHRFISQLMAPGTVTYEQAYAVFCDQMAWINYRQQMIPQLDELSAGDRAFFDAGTLNYRSVPLLKLWYEYTKSILSPDVVRYIDNLLAQPR